MRPYCRGDVLPRVSSSAAFVRGCVCVCVRSESENYLNSAISTLFKCSYNDSTVSSDMVWIIAHLNNWQTQSQKSEKTPHK